MAESVIRRSGSATLADLRAALTGLGAAADETWRADIEDPGRTDDVEDAIGDPWRRGSD